MLMKCVQIWVRAVKNLIHPNSCKFAPTIVDRKKLPPLNIKTTGVAAYQNT